MTDQINASPTDIRKLAAALKTYRDEVRQASRSVQGALGAANWHDQRKQQFEARYRDLQKQIDRFMSGEVDSMINGLNQLASKLEEIRTTRF